MLQRLFSQEQWSRVFFSDSIIFIISFHFKNESTDLIYWYTCLYSPLFTLRRMLFLTYGLQGY